MHVACFALLQVYERRKAPAGYNAGLDASTDPQDSTSSSKDSKKESSKQADALADSIIDNAEAAMRVGGGVRLEMNGLKAIAAISKDLAGRVVSEGLYANKVLLHDTIGERQC